MTPGDAGAELRLTRLWLRVAARSRYLLMKVGLILKSTELIAIFNRANYFDGME